MSIVSWRAVLWRDRYCALAFGSSSPPPPAFRSHHTQTRVWSPCATAPGAEAACRHITHGRCGVIITLSRSPLFTHGPLDTSQATEFSGGFICILILPTVAPSDDTILWDEGDVWYYFRSSLELRIEVNFIFFVLIHVTWNRDIRLKVMESFFQGVGKMLYVHFKGPLC